MKNSNFISRIKAFAFFAVVLFTFCVAFSSSAFAVSDSIAHILPHSVEISEHTNGFAEADTDNAGNTVSWYRYTDITPEVFTVEFTNGTREDYTYDDFLDLIQASESETETDQSFENQWGPGQHTAVIEIGGFVCEYTVKITQNEISGISVPDISVKEGVDGEYIGICDENGSFTGEYWFKYSYAPAYYTVNYKNGASENVEDISALCSLLGAGVEEYTFSDSQSEKTPWSDGGYKGTLTAGDYSCEYSVKVEDNGILSASASDISVVEGTECYFEQKDNCFYYNSVPSEITVTYKDGSVEKADFTEFTEEHGFASAVCDGQSSESLWSTGKHTAVLYLGGCLALKYEVEIVPSSIERIEAENAVYYEDTYGREEAYINEEDETEHEWFLYDANPQSFTVYYKDGTVKGFTYDELYEADGLCYEIITDQTFENQWGTGEHNAIFRTVFGDCAYKVQIEEYPYTDISFEKVTVKEGTNGYYSTHYDGYNAYKYYVYNIEPQRFTVTDKNGESSTYDFTYESFQAVTGYTPCFENEQTYDNSWLAGVHSVNAVCGSRIIEYTVEVMGHGLTDISVENVTLTEGTDGKYGLSDEEAEHYFIYNANPDLSFVSEGNTVKTTAESFKNDAGFDCAVNLQNPYNNTELKPGKYTAYFLIGNSSYAFEAETKEGNVESISAEKITLTEKADGIIYALSEGDGYYYHYYPKTDAITVNFKNGTSFTGSPDELSDMSIDIFVYDSQSEETPWKAGENKGVIAAGGKMCEYTVQILSANEDSFDYTEITAGQTVIGQIGAYSQILYKFIPDLTAEYTLSLTLDGDIYCSVLDSRLNVIGFISATDSGLITLTEKLTAGETYFFAIGNYSEEDVTAAEITLSGPVCQHLFVNYTSNNDATCTEDGTKTAQCEYCIKTKTITDANSRKGHALSGWTVAKEATCTETGSKTRGCSRCSFTETQIISAKGHTNASAVKENYKNPTCTAEGSYQSVVYCLVCSNELSRETVKVSVSGHTPEAISAVAATCSSAGYTEGKRCKVCSAVLEAPKETAKLSHTWIASSCTTAKMCSVCKTTEGSAAGHTVVTVPAVAPTCNEKGYTEGEKCSVCGTVVVPQAEIPATGHREAVLEGLAATCTEKGLTEGKKCTYCGTVTVAQREVSALGHREVILSSVAATCTEKGLTEGKACTACGETLVSQKEISHLGHKEAVIASVEPTCETAGFTEGKRCTVCYKVTVAQKELSATGHTEVVVYGKEATCTESGLTNGKKCAVCDKITKSQTEIKAKGHTEEALPAKAATYKATGLTEGKICTACDTVTVEQKKTSIKKLGKVQSLKVKKTTSGSVTLSWKKVTGAESYKVYYSADGKKWKRVSTKKNSVTIKKLTSAKTYRFKVKAVAGKYSGSASSVVKGTTKFITAAISKVTSSKKKTAVVSWKQTGNASGYVIEYSTSKSFTKKTTKTVTVKKGKTTKTTLKKLKSGKKYYVRVKAYKTVNDTAVYGAYSEVKTVKVK